MVYGPQGEAAKLQFLQELKNIPPPEHNRWLILGDFNLIYQAEDKNNSNLNRCLMGAFKATIDHLRLKEIKLNGRRFTWSNQQENPTLTRIDKLLCTPKWELCFPSCFLHSLPSLMSDHTPLLLQGEIDHNHSSSFALKITRLRWKDSKILSTTLGIGRSPPFFQSNVCISRWRV